MSASIDICSSDEASIEAAISYATMKLGYAEIRERQELAVTTFLRQKGVFAAALVVGSLCFLPLQDPNHMQNNDEQ